MIFGRQRRKMDNAVAAANLPKLPPNHTTNNYGTNWPLIIPVTVGCVLLLLPFLWFFLVYIIEQAGYRKPEEQLAKWVLLVLFLAVLFWLVGLAFRSIGGWILELQREANAHKQAMKELEQRLMEAEITRNALPAPSESRLTEEDSKLRVNLIAVMTRAYDRIKTGEYVHKEARPWSQDQVYQNPPSESTRMRYAKTGKVREWLLEHKVVIGEPGSDQVNMTAFPGILEFMQEVEKSFHLPVVVNPGRQVSPTSNYGRYESIEV